jgi:hypothetical protein
MEGRMTSGISKEHLQYLGKSASDRHLKDGCSLTDAVVSVIDKKAGFTAEHVKRVVEFANNETFKTMFDSMSGDHRVVNIKGGPASPSAVLSELEMKDNAPSIMKTAAHAEMLRAYIPGEDEFFGGRFSREKVAHVEQLPMSRPHGDLIDLHSQINALRSTVIDKLSSAELEYNAAASNMHKIAKRNIMDGQSPAEISIVFQRVSPSSTITKLALKLLSERIGEDGIPAVQATGDKIKQASEGEINRNNPLVRSFLEFAKTAAERALLCQKLEEVDFQASRVNREMYKVMK